MLSPVPWCASSYGAWLPAAVPASATWGCDCNPRAPQHCVSIVGWSNWVGGEFWPFFEVALFWGDELGKMGKILQRWLLNGVLLFAMAISYWRSSPNPQMSQDLMPHGFFTSYQHPPTLSSYPEHHRQKRSLIATPVPWCTMWPPYQQPLQQGWRLAFWWRSADPKIQLGLSFW